MLTQISNRLPVLFKSALARKLDAPETLTQDHVKVETLFLQLKFMTRAMRSVPASRPSLRKDLRSRSEALFGQIRSELAQHMAAEEQIFYPECERTEDLQGKIGHAREEHDEVKTLLSDMESVGIDDATFDEKLNVLIKNVMHHAREEEEEIFPVVRGKYSRSRLERLASQMNRVKRSVRNERSEKGGKIPAKPGEAA